jgi:polysaccharide deacetylase family protein (PEP-CTERM system associated)
MNEYSIPNAFTVDVEDYFQVSAFEHRVSRKNWDSYESRVATSTEKLLALLTKTSTRGTFFILGWVADRFPALVKRIHDDGHEIASHGYWHKLIYSQQPEEFRQDLIDSRDAIANACGVEVTAYRAPSFSITQRSFWAIDILIECGFTVDSSIFPIVGHDRYGVPGAKREVHDLVADQGTLIEFPPSAWYVGKFNIPVGGGYFRIFPWPVSKKAIEKVRADVGTAMFYIHPWEVDPQQPRVAGIGWKSKLRHYTGQRTTYDRLEKMLTGSRFASMSQVIEASHAISPRVRHTLPMLSHQPNRDI